MSTTTLNDLQKYQMDDVLVAPSRKTTLENDFF